MMVLWIVLAVNLLCAIVYAVVKIGRKEGPGTAVFFLFLPVLGFVIYFLPRLIQKLLGRERYDRDSLVQRFQIDRLAEHPDVREELSVVPVEDAMAVSGNAEKRALLLKQLKKDASGSYRVLLAAENDQDSESVHYVAAAKMEAYRVQQRRWGDCRAAYIEDPDAPENFHQACAALGAIIDGSVLSAREREMQQRKYCGLIQEQERRSAAVISRREYGTYLSYLVDLNEYGRARRLWEERWDQVKSEAAYMKMMELFYKASDSGGFQACVRRLEADKDVRLSAQGLERLRYWRARCEDGAAPERRAPAMERQ